MTIPLTIEKYVTAHQGDVPTYTPGDSFSYTMNLQCTSTESGVCEQAVLTDTLPEPLVFDGATPVSISPNLATISIAGRTATLAFNSGGLGAGQVPTVTIKVVVPIGTPADFDGATLKNTASISADNAETVSDSADVKLNIATALSAKATKTATPTTTIPALPGRAVTYTIGGANTSNVAVDSLVLTDPASLAGTSPYDYLAVTGLSDLTPPAGADRVKLDWYDGTAWQPGSTVDIPADPSDLLPADPSLIMGLRFTFTNSGGRLPAGRAAQVTITTLSRDSVAAGANNTTLQVSNTVNAQVVRDSSQADDNASAAVNFRKEPVTVSVNKSYATNELVAGQSTTATITAQNGVMPVHELVISEPGTPGDTDLAAQNLTFVGFVTTGAGSLLTWPTGADTAEITYRYADGTGAVQTTTTEDTLPASEVGRTVVGFTIRFASADDQIAPRAEAIVPFRVTAGPVTAEPGVTSTNTTRAQVTSAALQTATANDSADLVLVPLRVRTETSKNIAKDWIWAAPGTTALVALTGKVSQTSTTGSQYLQLTDEAVPAGSTFWNYMDLTRITSTDVPANTTLTVTYFDGTTWQPLAGPVVGPVSNWSFVPTNAAQIQGLRFRFDPRVPGDLLPAGFNVAPRFEVALRRVLRSDGSTSTTKPFPPASLDNTVQSEVANPLAIEPMVTRNAQDAIELVPTGGGGRAPVFADKRWLDPHGAGVVDSTDVSALTDATRTALVTWQNDGLDLTSLQVTDDPRFASVATSFYDAFNLTRIRPITTSDDPLIATDKVAKVELYDGGSWVDITSAACASGCDGRFGGYTLTVAESAATLAARLTFTSLTVGGLVTNSSSDQPARPIWFDYQLRRTLRSAPTGFVLGTTHSHAYNTGANGVVSNKVTATGTLAQPEDDGNDTFSSSASADITIFDQPLNVTTTKVFDQSEIGLPQRTTTDPADYPLIQATLTGTNNTASFVPEVSLTDPAPATVGYAAYDFLNLYQIELPDIPADLTTSDVTVDLRLADGSTLTRTHDEVLAMAPSDLVDVVGVTVHFGDRDNLLEPGTAMVASGESGTALLTFQLRSTLRSDPAQFIGTTAQVTNIVQGEVHSPGGIGCADGGTCDQPIAQGQDSFSIADPTYSVTATKSITPAQRYEDQPKTYTVALSGQPTGTARTKLLTLTDDTPTFWNAFTLAQLDPVVLPRPVNELQVEALTGVQYSESNGGLVATCNADPDLSACWVRGDWVAATNGVVQPTLPAGVNAADVRGLRFNVQRTVSGQPAQWERPAKPTVTVRVEMVRRDLLVYGTNGATDTPVPSTRVGMAPAPGEPTQGVVTDQLVVDGVANWRTNTGPYTATASDIDTTTLRHRVNTIKVEKSPGQGTASDLPHYDLAATIGYALKITNTGGWSMTGLQLADQVTLVGGASPLVPGTTAPVFTLKLDGATWVGASATLDAATGALSIQVPGGFVFLPGSVITIGANLELRSRLPAGTLVSNDVTATSDRPFEKCEFTTDANLQPALTGQLADCRATTRIVTAASTPISVAKAVKGTGAGAPGAVDGSPNYDDLGVIAVGAAVSDACQAPNLDGFYTAPCAPITRPGGTETWKLNLTNNGNVAANVVSAIDVLPTPGDTGVTIATARKSRFRPTFLGNVRTSLANGAASHNFSTYYTTQTLSPACNKTDILNDTRPGGTANCGTNWQLVTGSTTATELATAKALKFVLAFTDPTQGLTPGEELTVRFDTRTPAYADVSDSLTVEPIAWNSVAVGSRTAEARDADGNVTFPARASLITEPRKVGVALASGTLDLAKTVVTPAARSWASLLPAGYDFTVTCSSDGTAVPLRGSSKNLDTSKVTLPASGAVIHYNATGGVNLPLFADCSITENPLSQGSVVTVTPNTATALRDYSVVANVANGYDAIPGNVPSLTATNTYADAGFTVTKAIDGPIARDANGDPVHFKDFTYTASCIFLGNEVVPVADRTFSLRGGQSKAFTQLPAGAVCAVQETYAAGADSTSVTLTQGSQTNTYAGGAFTLVAGDETATTVAYVNTYTVGAATITKAVGGSGAADWGNETFEAKLECTSSDADPATVYTATSVLSKTSPTWTVGNLASGANCTVTEVRTGGANSSSISPGSFPVGKDAASPTAVTVTNTFTTGAVQVTKSVLANGAATTAAPWADGTYPVTLSCTRTVDGIPQDVAIPGGPTQTLTSAGNWKATYPGLPTGSTCTATEDTGALVVTPAQPDPTVTITGPVTVGDGTTAAIGVTNDFPAGKLVITKALTGAGTGFFSGATFAVSCSLTGYASPVFTRSGITVTNPSLASAQVGPIPFGSECTVTETSTGGADTTPDHQVVPAQPNVTTANVTTVGFTNSFSAGKVTLTKTLAGEAAAASWATNATFTLAVKCGLTAAGPYSYNGNVAIKGGQSVELISGGTTQLFPIGTHCWASETNSQGATNPSVDHDTFTNAVVVTADPSAVQALTINATNEYTYAGFTVTKTVATNGATDQNGTAIVYTPSFTFTAVCTFNGAQVLNQAFTSTKQPDLSWSSRAFNLLPTGASCTVTETGRGSANPTQYRVTQNGVAGTQTSGSATTFTLAQGDSTATTAAFTNNYLVGSVNLAKILSPANATWATGTFSVRLLCTFTGVTTPATVYDKTFTFDKAALLNQRINNLPTGASCTVSEPQAGGANSVSIPTPTFPVSSSLISKTITNTFTTGSVAVTKALKVDGLTTAADPWASGQYSMTLSCTRLVNGTTETLTVPGATKVITGSGTATWTGLPTGANCSASETGIAWPNGAPDQPIPVTTYSSGVTVNTATVTQTVTNDFISADLQVQKNIAGEGATTYGAGPFTFDVSCTLPGFASPVFTRTGIALTRIATETTLTSAVVGPIPVGATCAVTETGTGGSTSVAPVSKVVTLSDLPASPTQTAAFTNTFTYAGFTVTKAVDNGGAVDGAGTAVGYAGSYAFTASCMFKGGEVVASADRNFTLSRQVDGTWSSKAFSQLPTGAICTVTESGIAGAASTRLVVTQGASTLSDATATSATFTLASGDASATSVAFTNRYSTGGLDITKIVTGSGATLWGGGSFGVRLLCLLDNDANSTTAAVTVFDQTRNLVGSELWQVRNLPSGATCTVTEPRNGGANGTTISGGSPTITTGNQAVTLTNTFTVGQVRVTKALRANGTITSAQPWASGTYPVDLVCTKDFNNDGTAETLSISDSHQVLTGAGTHTWSNLPTGASCTVTEGTSVVPGQPQATVSAGTVTVVSATRTDLTLSNDFAAGKLVLHKNITGNGAANGTGPFTFSVACTLTGFGTVFSTTVTLTPTIGQTSLDSAALGPIPFTSVCAFTETDRAGAASVATPAPITITPNAVTSNTSTATFSNDFTLAGFTVTKAVDNGGAQNAAGTAIGYTAATFSAGCTFQGTNVVAVLDRTFTLAAGQSKPFTGLPTGAVCTVTETGVAGAAASAVVVTQGGTSVATGTTSASFTVAVGDATASTVAFTNTYTTGSLQVTKQLTGAGAPLWGGETFTARLVCTLATATPTAVYDATHNFNRASLTWTVPNLPTGATCTVTETATGGANTSVLTGGTLTVGTGTSQATIINNFTLGAIRVTKALTVDGAATTAEPWTSGAYTVELQCSRLVDGVTQAIAVPGGASRVITGAGSATYTDLPTGATCVVAETGSSPVAQGVTLTPATGAVTVNSDPSTPVAVGLSNDFHTAYVSIRKQIAGAGGQSLGSGPFDFAVRCTLAGATDPVFTDTVRLTRPAGSTASSLTSDPLGPVPVGAVCTITESANGHADVTPDPVTLTVAEDDAANLAVLTNQFSAGTVWLTKQLSGAAASEPWATGAAFTVEVTCQLEVGGVRGTVLSRTVELAGGDRVNVLDADGNPSRVPLGSHCFAVETDAHGAGSTSVDHADYDSAAVVTAGTPADLQALELHVTNTYEYAGFTVAKSVDAGGAVDALGNAVAYPGQFEFAASCSFDGAVVLTEAFTLVDGSSRDFSGLPAGAVCTINESDPINAPHTSLTVTQNGASTGPMAGTGGSFTLQRGGLPFFEAAPGVNAAAFENRYDTGAVTITKQVVGTGVGDWGNADFTVALVCTLDTDADPATPDVTVYDATHLVSRVDPIWSVSGLAAGAGCTVTETDNGGASEPAEPQAFTVGSDPGDPSPVTLVNSFGTAPVVVTKTISADGVPVTANTQGWAAQLLTGSVQVQLACTRVVNGVVLPAEVPGGAERNLDAAGDWRVVYHGLPLDAECSVTEVASSPAASSVDYSATAVTVVAGDAPATISITNDYLTGSLAVTKQILGAGASAFGDGPFRFAVSCTLAGLTDPVFTDTVTLSSGNLTSVTLGPIPTGASCTVTETDAGGASQPAPPATAVIGAGTQAAATLANTFDTTGFTVTKSVDSGGAVDSSGQPVAYLGRYGFTASCTFDDNGEVLPSGERSFTLATGESHEVTGLPVGADCTVTETGAGNAAGTTSVATSGGLEVSGGSVSRFPLSAEGAEASFINSYTVGSAVISKELTGDGSAAWGTATFTLRTVCTLDTDADHGTQDVVVYDGTGAVSAADPQWRIDNLPTGADCMVSETAAGGANMPADAAPFTVGSGEPPAMVTMTNEFTTGSVRVTKRLLLDGEPTVAQPFAGGSYDIQLVCSREVNGTVEPVDIPGDGAEAGDPADGRRTITGAGSVTYLGLPTGASCTVTEVASSLPIPSSQVSVDTDHVRVRAGEVAEVEVANDFHTGTLSITKLVRGVGASFGTGPFDFSVKCTMPGAVGAVFVTDVTLTPSFGGTTVTSGQIGPIPVGATCTVTETGAGGADAASQPQPAIIGEGEQGVTLVNQYSAGTVNVTKKLTGPGAKYHARTGFVAHVTCAVSADARPVLETDVPLLAGQTNPVTDGDGQPVLLPVGTHCWAIETDDGGARATTVDHVSFDNALLVTAGSPQEVQGLLITITNDFADPNDVGDVSDHDGDGSLAFTGSSLPPWLPLLALVLIACGIWLIRRGQPKR